MLLVGTGGDARRRGTRCGSSPRSRWPCWPPAAGRRGGDCLLGGEVGCVWVGGWRRAGESIDRQTYVLTIPNYQTYTQKPKPRRRTYLSGEAASMCAKHSCAHGDPSAFSASTTASTEVLSAPPKHCCTFSDSAINSGKASARSTEQAQGASSSCYGGCFGEVGLRLGVHMHAPWTSPADHAPNHN